MAYQPDESVVGADINFRLEDNILSYFIQASFSIFLG